MYVTIRVFLREDIGTKAIKENMIGSNPIVLEYKDHRIAMNDFEKIKNNGYTHKNDSGYDCAEVFFPLSAIEFVETLPWSSYGDPLGKDNKGKRNYHNV